MSEITYKSMSNVPGDYDCQDGASALLVNLTVENGEVRPYLQPALQVTVEGRLVCVHKGSGYCNYITLDEGTLYWQSYEDGELSERTELAAGITDFQSCKIVGNTLVILSEPPTPVQYVLFKDGKYTYLGDQLPFPEITFTTDGGDNCKFQWIKDNDEYTPDPPNSLADDERNDNTEQPSTDDIVDYCRVELPEVRISGNESTYFDDAEQIEVTTYVFGAINSALAEYRKKGYYAFPALIRYALRLYDGSYTLHSAPVLLWHDTSYFDNVKVTRYSNDTVEIQMRYWRIGMEWPGYDDKWSDIVKSVDFFLSAPIYNYGQDEMITHTEYSSSGVTVVLPWRAAADVDDDIKACGQFYKVYSIPVGETDFKDFEHKQSQSGETYTNPDTTQESSIRAGGNYSFGYYWPESVLTTIEQHELMSDEYQSHHKISAGTSYMYNNRLHLGDVTSLLFGGFTWQNMTAGWWSSSTTAWTVDRIVIDTWLSTDYKEAHVRLDVQIDGGMEIQYRGVHWLYYPDPRATKMTISLRPLGSNDYLQATFDLEEHETLNGAYYYLYLNQNIEDLFTEVLLSDLPSAPTEEDQIINVPNNLYVSVSSNPFVFEALQIYTIGQSQIIALASTTSALSQGQFGEFPLYVFTGEGIWAMTMATDGTYKASQMTARDVCNNGLSVTEIDNAVIFTTDRGLMIIHGSTVSCLSEVMHGPTFDPYTLEQIERASEQAGVEEIMKAVADYRVSFREFLRGCSIAYDYPNQRLLMVNAAYPYSYLYLIDHKCWSIVTGEYTGVFNAYPDYWLLDDHGNVFDFSGVLSDDDTTETKGFLITRPLKLDGPATLKTVSTVLTRGNFNPRNMSTVLYGSRVGVQYHVIGSSQTSRLRHTHGSPYFYFRLFLAVTMLRREAISYTTIETATKYTNRPR